jgi:hypothetical protein
MRRDEARRADAPDAALPLLRAERTSPIIMSIAMTRYFCAARALTSCLYAAISSLPAADYFSAFHSFYFRLLISFDTACRRR